MNAAAVLLVRAPPAKPGADLGLLDHLRELQARVLSVVLAWVALLALFFGFGARAVALRGLVVPVPWPSVHDSVAAGAFRAMAARFTPANVELVVTSPLDGVVALFVVALALAAAAATPAAAWHAGMFLGPALHPSERKVALLAVPLAVGLFAAGVAFAWTFVVPVLFATLYGYAAALDARLLLDVHALVTFAAVMLLVLGVAFEVPLVMAALTRAGLVEAATWRTYWRHATLAIVILAAVVTPDPTVVSQAFVAVPLLVLYLLGSGAAAVVSKGPAGRSRA